MKRILLTLLQVTVTAVMLYFVFRDPHKRADMASAMRGADLRWVAAAILAAALSPLVGVVRWGILLRAQGIVLRWARVAQIYMIGAFFNLFLIGSTGGDAVKMFYALRENAARGKRAGAILSVVIDRLLGLLALILIGIVFVALRYDWLTKTPKASALLASFGAIMGMAGGAFVFALVLVVFNLADKLPGSMPGRAKVLELSTACRLCIQEWRATLAGFLISLAGHSSFFFTFYFASCAVHAEVRFWDISAIMPIVNTIVSLPISVSGVGIRENLFVDLLGDLCGVGAGKAAPISMIGFLCSTIFYGLVGGVVYLLFRSHDDEPAAPSDLMHLEAQLERQVDKDATLPGAPILPPARPPKPDAAAMHVTLVAAITFDGRLVPLAAAAPSPGTTRAVAFQNARRATSVCDWIQALPAEERVQCEISRPAAAPVARALLLGGLVDDLCLTVCPIISNRRDAATLTGPPTPEFLPAAIALTLQSMETAGDVCVLRYAVNKSGGPLAPEGGRTMVGASEANGAP